MGIVNHRYPLTRPQVSRKARGSRHPEMAPELSLISVGFLVLTGIAGWGVEWFEGQK